MEAMQKLKDGQRFSDVATAYSEDKARQGVSGWTLFCSYTSYVHVHVHARILVFPSGAVLPSKSFVHHYFCYPAI